MTIDLIDSYVIFIILHHLSILSELLINAIIFSLSIDMLIQFLIALLVRSSILVNSCVHAVPVEHLRNVLYPTTRHLHRCVVLSIISDCPVEFSLWILEGVHTSKQEEVAQHCSKVMIGVVSLTIEVLINNCFSVIVRMTNFDSIGQYIEIHFTGVDRIYSFLLIYWVQSLQDLGSNQFIISIYNHENLIEVAEFMNRIIDVLHRSALLLIVDYDHFFSIDVSPFQMFCYRLEGWISGGIIDNNQAIIRVLLLENWLEMPYRSVSGYVIEGWTHDAGVKFIFLPIIAIFFCE